VSGHPFSPIAATEEGATRVLKTALAQLKIAASLGLGRPFPLAALDHLVEAMKETRREFGAIETEEGASHLGGPVLDEESRHELHLRRFRAQAARAARETDYYGRLFEWLGLDPEGFVSRSSTPCFRTTTTGTTGKPTSVCFSERELRSYVALSAISGLSLGRIDESDVVQLSTSSRATLGNSCFAEGCARIGALVHLAGLLEPASTLELLTEKRHVPGKKPKVSYMTTYASYLGELVECGLARGYGSADFGLERVSVGGELVSDGLKRRARRLFGDDVRFDEDYGITELWPFGGQGCSEGHLHFEPTAGLLEVLDPETGRSAGSDQAGTIVATPLPPYRETTLVLRYDTQDVVRPVEGPLACELRAQPATSPLLGKLRFAARHEGGWTFARDVVEALEVIEDVPLPARYGFWVVPGGIAVEVAARRIGAGVRNAIAAGLEERGVPVRELNLVGHPDELRHPVPLRSDLKETAFGARGGRGAHGSEPVMEEAAGGGGKGGGVR
jgi:phenylacetate-CoA ligase